MTDGVRERLTVSLAERYVIDREIGRGGMATVYLARDVKHERKVALKLLDPDLGAVLGAERFLSEIRVTANLQHPNLLPLFDSGATDGLLWYVMPFVDGESLRARLDRERQLPIDAAVRIATAIASALDYAHQHGIIHRDLKPENILLQHGEPVVADFGIALAISNAGGQRVTQTGLSLGTPLYMSPEQATGDRVIDARSDIYSLGAVTYEMIAGEPPHTGSSSQAIIARLMTELPRPLATVRHTVPEHVDDAVRCALEKLPADRFATAKEFADALRGDVVPSARRSRLVASAASVSSKRLSGWRSAALVAGALALVSSGVALTAWRAPRGATLTPIRFVIDPPAGKVLYDRSLERPVAISADGKAVAFAAGTDGQLFLRRLDQLEPVPLATVDNPGNLRFSPDAKWLGFRGNNQLLKVAVTVGDLGAAPTLIRDTVRGGRFDWMPNAEILYSDQDALWLKSNTGGSPRLIARRDTLQDGRWWNPVVVDNGRTVSFRISPRGTMRPGTTNDRLGLVFIDGGPRRLVDIEVQNVLGYVDGCLIYGRSDGRIMGVRIDLGSGKLSGDPIALLDNVSTNFFTGAGAVLSANGTLAYFKGKVTSRVDVVNEHGAILSTLPIESRRYSSVNWSPDGTRLLLATTPDAGSDLWVFDTASHVTTRLTPNGYAQLGIWTPDGKRIAFMNMKQGNAAYWVPADGSAPAEPIPQGAGFSTGFRFSRDGKYLMVYTPSPPASTPFTAIPMAGGSRVPILAGTIQPSAPVTSPNGRWIAYSSTESGQREIYIRAFPSGEGRFQVSLNGGGNLALSPDGRRLYYQTPTALRMATLNVAGSLPRVERIDSLFPTDRDYSPHPDGKRFAVVRESSSDVKLVVVTNWLSEILPKLKGR